MLKKRLLVGATVLATTMGISVVAMANGGSYHPGYTSPAPLSTDNGAGFYIGGQAGYALTHWDNVEQHTAISPNLNISDEDGFAGRVFAGYAFNKYFGAEVAWSYLPSRVKVKAADDTTSSARIKNWTGDLSGVLTVPLQGQFGVFAKVGLDYFSSSDAPNLDTSTSSVLKDHDVATWNVVYGAGVYYDITPELRASLAWRRVTGDADVNSDYQPSPDVFLAGLQYRFATDFFGGDSF